MQIYLQLSEVISAEYEIRHIVYKNPFSFIAIGEKEGNDRNLSLSVTH